MNELSRRLVELEDELEPLLPEVPLPKSKQPNWPRKQFKKDGTATEIAKRYYGEDHSVYRTDQIVLTEKLSLTSPVKVQEFLLTQGWVPLEWNTKKIDGKKVRMSPKLTEESFDSIKGELGQKIALHRRLSSKRNTLYGWLVALREDDTIRTPISGKAGTHRLRHKLVANVPRNESFYGRECREVFIARPGMVLVGCDSEACQLRMLAEEMGRYGLGDQRFTDAIVTGHKDFGTDPHSVNRDSVNRIVGYEVLDRTKAKTVLYASFFGASVEKVALILKCTLSQAKAVMGALFQTMPGIPELKEILVSEFKQRKYLTSGLDGRKLYGNSPHSLLVWLMQLDEAVSMEAAMCRAHADLEGYPAHQLIYYHDELDWEADIEVAEDVKKILLRSIEWSGRYYRMTVPLKGEAKIGNNWMEIH